MRQRTMIGGLGCAVLTLLTPALFAEHKLADAFDYPDGPLVGAPGSPWAAHSQLNNGPVTVLDGHIELRSDQAEDINAALAGDPVETNSPAVVLYAAFTINVRELPTRGGSYFAHFRSGNTQRGRIWLSTADAAEGMFRVGIVNSSSGDATSGTIPLDLATNIDYRMVARYDVATGLSSIGLDPKSEDDLEVTAADEVGLSSISGFAFRQAAGMGALWVDDLVIVDRFEDLQGTTSMRLEISWGEEGLEISWPALGILTDSAWVLEVCENVDEAAWETVAEPPIFRDGRQVVRWSMGLERAFFRLRSNAADGSGE